MSKRIFFTFAILFIAIVSFSCEGDFTIEYAFTNLKVMHADNSGEEIVLNNSGKIPAKAYVMRLYFFTDVSIKNGRYADPETPPSCTNGIHILKITSTSDFDANHPAGTILNKHFIILNGNYLTTSPLDTVNVDPTNVYSKEYTAMPAPLYADLLLMKKPDDNSKRKFIVHMELDDGQIFTDTTSYVKLY